MQVQNVDLSQHSMRWEFLDLFLTNKIRLYFQRDYFNKFRVFFKWSGIVYVGGASQSRTFPTQIGDIIVIKMNDAEFTNITNVTDITSSYPVEGQSWMRVYKANSSAITVNISSGYYALCCIR